METNRRNFLIQTATAAGVLGLGALLWENPVDPPESAPADAGKPPREKPATGLLAEALRRMAAENKPGVAIRIPSAPAERCAAGHVLVYLLNDESLDVAGLFAESVIICLEDGEIQEQIRGADPQHFMVLFDGGRRAIAGSAVDLKNRWEQTGPALTRLLHGDADDRLRTRAESIRKTGDPDVLAALDRMGGDSDGNAVLARASTMAPLLVYEWHRAAAPVRRDLLYQVLRTYIDEANPKAPGPRLPFGLEAGREGGGCGDECLEQPGSRRGSVACGMGVLGPKSRTFVRYLKA